VARFEVDEQIYVAVGSCFTTGERPESTQMSDAVPLGSVEESAALAPQFVGLRTQLASH
jgi:hypothetical protein